MDHTSHSEHLKDGLWTGVSPWLSDASPHEDWPGQQRGGLGLRAEDSCPDLRVVLAPSLPMSPSQQWALFPHCRARVFPHQRCHLQPLISHPLSPNPVSLGSFLCSRSHSCLCFFLMPQNKSINNISKILKINADEIVFLFSWECRSM